MVLISLIVGFVFTPLDSTHVYMDTQGYASLNFELYNNAFIDATYNLVIKRVSAPSDLSFQMCFHNQCHTGDSDTIVVAGGVRDTITLDFVGGNNTGPIDIYYVVYDVNAPNNRDSIEITGGVPVFEKRKDKDILRVGDYVYGDGIISAKVLTKDGRILKSIYPKNGRIYIGDLRDGLYFLSVMTRYGNKILKIYRRR